MKYPAMWQKFRNKKSGKIYEHITTTNINATKSGWVVTAVYQDYEGNVWSRLQTISTEILSVLRWGVVKRKVINTSTGIGQMLLQIS